MGIILLTSLLVAGKRLITRASIPEANSRRKTVDGVIRGQIFIFDTCGVIRGQIFIFDTCHV